MFDQQAAGNDEGWTNVTTSLPARSSYEPTNQGLAESLPELDSLPRPERLFETTLPYHMIVRIRESNVNSGIVVQSSHQPSLELLAAYLTKYTKSMKGVATKVRESFSHALWSFSLSPTFVSCDLSSQQDLFPDGLWGSNTVSFKLRNGCPRA